MVGRHFVLANSAVHMYKTHYETIRDPPHTQRIRVRHVGAYSTPRMYATSFCFDSDSFQEWRVFKRKHTWACKRCVSCGRTACYTTNARDYVRMYVSVRIVLRNR